MASTLAAAPSTALWLMRHGKPSEESQGRCYGSLDVSLSAEGIRQIEGAACLIPAQSLSAIYCSPRTRCFHSAQLLNKNHACAIEIIEDLSEINFGEFEGRRYDEIAATHPHLYRQWMEHPTEVQFPGGESFSQLRDRVLRTSQLLVDRHQGSAISIVAHGGVNRIILAAALGVADHNIFRIAQHYAAVSKVLYFGDYPSVELLNATA